MVGLRSRTTGATWRSSCSTVALQRYRLHPFPTRQIYVCGSQPLKQLIDKPCAVVEQPFTPVFPFVFFPSQFVMVKFLCTRQDTAERLGVQSLSFNGYLCHGAEKLGDLGDLSRAGAPLDPDTVTGLCLLNKTLFFIQQLTEETVTHHLLKNGIMCVCDCSLNDLTVICLGV